MNLPEATERANWYRSIRLSGFTIATLTVLILAIVVLAPSLKIFFEQQHQIAVLRAEVESQKGDLNDLKDERARWDDPNYIEAQARERLNYVYPGEYSYLVIDDLADNNQTDGLPISDKVQSAQVDWIGVLLSSVLTASLTQEKPGEIVAPVIGTGG
ncbi:MAG: septum formation initiator family protein [Microbacteriaceae bacterium]|nr:septum formation initiator family protein [Cryobacterium sp.]MCC6376556.1 septum formation initiator family protein [Microbacteriaceae bacterium]